MNVWASTKDAMGHWNISRDYEFRQEWRGVILALSRRDIELHVVEATVETFMMQMWKHIVSIGGSILEAYTGEVIGRH